MRRIAFSTPDSSTTTVTIARPRAAASRSAASMIWKAAWAVMLARAKVDWLIGGRE
jgi:hypothetical protein